MTVSPNEEDIRNCYHQSAAIVCRRCEEAVDLIIPVLLSDGRTSHISVQVKNYSKQKKSVEVVMLNNERAGLLDICGNGAPYLGLFMQVGCDIKSSLRVLSDTLKPRQSDRLKEKTGAMARATKRRKLGEDNEGIIIVFLCLFHLLKSRNRPKITETASSSLLLVCPRKPIQIWKTVYLKRFEAYLNAGLILFALQSTPKNMTQSQRSRAGFYSTIHL